MMDLTRENTMGLRDSPGVGMKFGDAKDLCQSKGTSEG
jgi:hypothetical protein